MFTHIHSPRSTATPRALPQYNKAIIMQHARWTNSDWAQVPSDDRTSHCPPAEVAVAASSQGLPRPLAPPPDCGQPACEAEASRPGATTGDTITGTTIAWAAVAAMVVHVPALAGLRGTEVPSLVVLGAAGAR